MKKLLTFLLLMTAGCSTTPASMDPVTAKIPEMRFAYWKNGAFVTAFGTSGDYFNVGDLKKFQLKLNSNGGNCQAVFDDGDNHFTQDCKGMSTLEMDLGTYSATQPSVIGISVAMQNLGTQQAFFYPNLRTQFTPLPVTYTCPHSDSHNGMSVCVRPATYNFNYIVQITDNFPGQMEVSEQCASDATATTTVLNIPGPEQIPLSLISNTPQFCSINLALRQNLQPNGTWADEKETTIDLNFYNPTYVPLPIPTVTQVAGGWSVCGAQEFKDTSINLVDGGSLGAGSCKTVTGTNVEIDAWDAIGRFSWNASPGRVLLADFNSKRISPNGFYFYTLARPWAEQQMRAYCPTLTKKCILGHVNALMHDPKMVEAIEKWDSNVLYQ